jgi:broad-specificity NMP kinase/uncharacterized protein (UPF0218 family)
MIIALTGTPGTGKTSIAEELSMLTGWESLSLNALVEKEGLYSGYDEKRKCRIADTDVMFTRLDKVRREGGALIIESHYAHDMPADIIVSLRTNPGKLRERYSGRGWSKEKIEENIEAEIMEVCRSESAETGTRTIELDTTSGSARESARKIAAMLEREGLLVTRELLIPESVREELREPYGKLFPGLEEALGHCGKRKLFSVGDQVGHMLLESKRKPEVLVYDGRIRRKPSGNRIETGFPELRTENKVGFLGKNLWRTIQDALSAKRQVQIFVEGEEDMAVLPLMLMAPEGACIIYGLFDRGVCLIEAGEESKAAAKELLGRIASSQ